jgi:Predicted acetyltransferase
MTPHPLDRVIWNALSTRLSRYSVGDDTARRLTDDIGPFAATRDDRETSLAALAGIIPDNETTVLFHVPTDVPTVPATIVLEGTAGGVQMIVETLRTARENADIEPLTDADASQMLALATLTRPGPFRTRTHTLGSFWGIKHGGQLVAMAGERMQLPGFTEVSGVCTHPSARGRGYGASLTHHVAAAIIARGEAPFLHAYANNAPAIAIYRALGFTLRSGIVIRMIRRAR